MAKNIYSRKSLSDNWRPCRSNKYQQLEMTTTWTSRCQFAIWKKWSQMFSPSPLCAQHLRRRWKYTTNKTTLGQIAVHGWESGPMLVVFISIRETWPEPQVLSLMGFTPEILSNGFRLLRILYHPGTRRWGLRFGFITHVKKRCICWGLGPDRAISSSSCH